jgi:hypothetical protein
MMAAMGMTMDMPWSAADVFFTFAMWAVMMVGMMAPSALPIHFTRDSERVLVVLQAAFCRRICRCFRASSNFRSLSAWISCCRPASMSFGVM